MVTSLDELAVKYGTDKSSKHHNYAKYYEELTKFIRHKVQGVLEIGVKFEQDEKSSALSLKMWRDWFENATIVGIDVNEKFKHSYGENIKVVYGDSLKKSVLNQAVDILPRLDLVVDDGCHIFKSAIATFEYLFPKLVGGGIYCIEDTLLNDSARYDNHRQVVESFVLRLMRDIETNNRYISPMFCSDFDKIDPDYCLNYYERWVESIEIHRGIYTIRKRK